MFRFPLSLFSALVLSGAALQAQEPGKVRFETYTLGNGLTVILSPDSSTQVVAVDLWYNVGSRNERPGRTGFAHLFEHMMFQGSANVKKAEHFQLVQRAGGQMNGSTTEDRTNYFEVLPSNRLALGLWLEADRMRSLAVNDTNFRNQREAVKEERRLRVDNQPYARAIVEESYALYDSTSCFPYSHSVIGSMDDLNAAQTSDVQEFFRQYYVPNNATLTVVGDFDPAEAKRLIQQYFAAVPKGDPPPVLPCSPTFNTGERRERVRDDKATLPATVRVYRVPSYDSPDMPALTLLATILGQGESSRLNDALVRQSKAAITAQSFINPFGPRRGPGFFTVFAITNQGVPLDSLDAQVAAQVARVRSDGVSDAELTKAKNVYRAGLIMERQRALSQAEALQSAAMFLGTPDGVNADLARYVKVTPADIKRVAELYLRPDNSLVLLVSSQPNTSNSGATK